jgi:endonuclease/exonuclease/phosphatase family metal-dependent hydrolase
MRVMSYNVYDFGNAADSRRYFTYDTILNIINREQPDVVNMQEYLVHIDDKVNMGVAVREAMKTRYIWFKPVITTKVDTTGIVMFSKYPVIGQDTIPTLNGIATEGMYMDVKKAGRIVRIYNLHMQSTRFSRADNAYLDSLSKKGSASLHESRSIVAKIKLAFINRAKQVAELKKLFAKCPYPYIITGDFNDTPLSYSVNNMARGIKNAFVEKGYGLGVTFYGEYPGFQLDYIMASPQFNIINYKIIRERISDHYPVISDLELK